MAQKFFYVCAGLLLLALAAARLAEAKHVLVMLRVYSDRTDCA